MVVCVLVCVCVPHNIRSEQRSSVSTHTTDSSGLYMAGAQFVSPESIDDIIVSSLGKNTFFFPAISPPLRDVVV